jgi:hypothetical protein
MKARNPKSGWGRVRDEDADDDIHLFKGGWAVCDKKMRWNGVKVDPTEFDEGHIPVNDGEFCQVCLEEYSDILVSRLPEDKRQFVETVCNTDCMSGHILGDCIHISECFEDSLTEDGYLMKEYEADEKSIEDYATVCPKSKPKPKRDRYEVIKV